MVSLRDDRPTVQVGDWIKLTSYHGGGSKVESHIQESGLGQVTAVSDHDLYVNLISSYGESIYNNYNVLRRTGTWEKLAGPPKLQGLLDEIPNTAEVQAFKDKAYELFMRYADRNGYKSHVEQGLRELGIRKPGSGTVTATVTFTVTAAVDEVIHGTDARTFGRQFERLDGRRKAEDLLTHSDNVTVVYEVKPYAPVIVSSPSAPAVDAPTK